MNFKIFQMDVKSVFLNGRIEEVYVDQPLGFLDYKHPNYVYKLKKALYGLKQAPRLWYDRLSSFLIEQSFTKGQVDKTLFIKKVNNELLIVQIYVDDIIFGATNKTLCNEFSCCMQKEFEVSMMGELNFFLSLQIKQMKHETFLSQTKYCIELIKKFGMKKCKETSTPMTTSTYLDLDEKGKSVDESRYRDSDFVGCKLDKKSTSGTCHLLGSSLVSWNGKKQDCVTLSTLEAEYIVVGSCCAQSLWMKQQLEDFEVNLGHISLICDNTSAINLTKNPIVHSRTKHIEIRHHFLRDLVLKGDCCIEFIDSEHQLADIFTKPLARDRFFFIRNELGILDASSIE